jgi:hypothetical protein
MFFRRKGKSQEQEGPVDIRKGVAELLKERDLEEAIQAVSKRHGSWFINTNLSIVRLSLRIWLQEYLLRQGVSEEEVGSAIQQILPSLSLRVAAYFEEYHRSPGLEKKLGSMTTSCYRGFLADVSGVRIKISRK